MSIDFVLGTLTQNVMKFKACWIEGISYGSDEEDYFMDPALKANILSGHVSFYIVGKNFLLYSEEKFSNI